MNDNLNSSHPTPARATPEHKVAVTVQIPLGLVKAIKQRAKRLGQSHNEVILDALQRLLSDESSLAASRLVTVEDLTDLVARISALETLSSQVEALQGKWIAS